MEDSESAILPSPIPDEDGVGSDDVSSLLDSADTALLSGNVARDSRPVYSEGGWIDEDPFFVNDRPSFP